jgi:hypothetical protein
VACAQFPRDCTASATIQLFVSQTNVHGRARQCLSCLSSPGRRCVRQPVALRRAGGTTSHTQPLPHLSVSARARLAMATLGRFCNEPTMQALGGPPATLGFILAAVGLGCIAGPLTANAVVPALPRWWRASIAASFALLALGYGLMAVAQHIGVVLAATVVRTMGASSYPWEAHVGAINVHAQAPRRGVFM